MKLQSNPIKSRNMAHTMLPPFVIFLKNKTLLTVIVCFTLLALISFAYNVSHLSANNDIRFLAQYEFLKSKQIPSFSYKQNGSCLSHLLVSVDETATCMQRDWMCDDLAGTSDIICRWYKSQNATRADVSCLLPDDQHLEDVHLEENLVPKIVYYVCVGIKEFTFLRYVSFLSARKFVKPWAIYVIGDIRPSGYWWDKVVADVGVRFVFRAPPKRINNQTVTPRAHAADVIRLQVLLANGGIYLDLDMLVLRSLDPLRVHDITLGLLDNGTGMGNAFIVAKRHSPFVRQWYENYKNYTNKLYYENSLLTARRLWLQAPSKVNMESKRLYNPNWNRRDLMFNRSDCHWEDNYGMHIWMATRFPFPKSPDDIKTMNNTLGQVVRYIYYGDSRMIV